MPRAADPALIAALSDGLVRLVFLFEGFFSTGVGDGALRFWTGVGDLVYGGFTWTGAGSLIGVGPASEGTEIKAQGITISLSGIPTELLALVFLNLRQGQRVNVYVGALGDGGGMLAPPANYFSGRVDVPSISDAGDTATISLAVENRFVDFEKTRSLFYTPQSQAIYFPADRGFENVTSLQDQKIFWGISE
jgi:hypothetical protein